MSEKHRAENDSLGEVLVPEGVYYGAQTQRAVDNFIISGETFSSKYISSLGLIKFAAAVANEKLGLLDEKIATAIKQAARDVMEAQLDEHFVVDIFQTGSGTSTNMNANEVISNRAIEILGGELGSRTPVHPNDHVNLCQSSNDVMPTALHITAGIALRDSLLPALNALLAELRNKSEQFKDIVKPARTHLQDATPIKWGQVFSGYAARVEKNIKRLEAALRELMELPLGGTAVGTGLNSHPDFARSAIEIINRECGLEFKETANHFETQNSFEAVLELSVTLKNTALAVAKIAEDIRWSAAGPRCGMNELKLPILQPGSSIMPGKVNPVIIESLQQVVGRIIGNEATISYAATFSNFELNTMLPLITRSSLESISLFSNAVESFTDLCLLDLQANEARCQNQVEKSLALTTALVPHIGYDRAAIIAKKAFAEDKTIKEVALAEKILTAEELDEILAPEKMT